MLTRPRAPRSVRPDRSIGRFRETSRVTKRPFPVSGLFFFLFPFLFFLFINSSGEDQKSSRVHGGTSEMTATSRLSNFVGQPNIDVPWTGVMGERDEDARTRVASEDKFCAATAPRNTVVLMPARMINLPRQSDRRGQQNFLIIARCSTAKGREIKRIKEREREKRAKRKISDRSGGECNGVDVALTPFRPSAPSSPRSLTRGRPAFPREAHRRIKLRRAKMVPRTVAVCDVKGSRFPSAVVKKVRFTPRRDNGGWRTNAWTGASIAKHREGRAVTNVGNYRIPGVYGAAA